jgi:hypothetical protein
VLEGVERGEASTSKVEVVYAQLFHVHHEMLSFSVISLFHLFCTDEDWSYYEREVMESNVVDLIQTFLWLRRVPSSAQVLAYILPDSL